jgi:hypothetical protein
MAIFCRSSSLNIKPSPWISILERCASNTFGPDRGSVR